MPMDSYGKQIVLLRNLLKRMTFNEPQGLWKLSGEITRDERDALQTALDTMEGCSNQ